MFIARRSDFVSALHRSATKKYFAPTERGNKIQGQGYKHFASMRRGAEQSDGGLIRGFLKLSGQEYLWPRSFQKRMKV